MLARLPFYEVGSYNISADEPSAVHKWASANKLASPASGGIRPFFTINGFSNALLAGCLDIRAPADHFVYEMNFHTYCSGKKLEGWLSINIILASEDGLVGSRCPKAKVDFYWRYSANLIYGRDPDL